MYVCRPEQHGQRDREIVGGNPDMRAQHTDIHGPQLLMPTHVQSDIPCVSHVHAGVPIGARADTHSTSSERMHFDTTDNRKGGPNSPPAPTQEPWPRVPARSSACGGGDPPGTGTDANGHPTSEARAGRYRHSPRGKADPCPPGHGPHPARFTRTAQVLSCN